MSSKEKERKTIVISAINLYQGGTFSVLLDCLQAFDNYNKNQNNFFEIVALVHNKENLPNFDINYIEFPKSRKSWLIRFYYEYFYFYFFSKNRNVFLWFSVHDISPFVKATKKVVYCHNPGPYYKATFKEGMLDKTFYLFTKFYKYLYGFNIKSNDYVIVQQEWIREFFKKNFSVLNVIVAYPEIKLSTSEIERYNNNLNSNTISDFIFFYPAIPRVFKNYEIIYEAVEILKTTTKQFKVLLTFKGTENKYAKQIINKYGFKDEIVLLGEIKREEVYNVMAKSHCLIFPSKLETWGLPISEAKLFKLPIIAANLPYAHETVGNYYKVNFFDIDNPSELAEIMKSYINHSPKYKPQTNVLPKQPFVNSWHQLIETIIK